MLTLLLVGYGKMGRLVGVLAPRYDCVVAGVVDPHSPSHAGGADDPKWDRVDVAVDFSTADAVPANAAALTRRGIRLVIGTTGWQKHEAEVRRLVEQAGGGAVAAPNFSTGVVLFEAIVARAAKLFAPHQDFGAFLHEAHHAAKQDAPSGTALLLKRAMEASGFARAVDVSSTRAGFIPGTHTVGFDGPAETITLTHSARDRTAFARGALTAAKWIQGRRGWYTMKDVLGVEQQDGS
jgi:4-hydroxy-tetrahydrodipicolinate reductase